MRNAKFLRWFKYFLGIWAVFIVVGFILQVGMEGSTPAQAWDLLLENGLYQSALFAIAVATLLTIK